MMQKQIKNNNGCTHGCVGTMQQMFQSLLYRAHQNLVSSSYELDSFSSNNYISVLKTNWHQTCTELQEYISLLFQVTLDKMQLQYDVKFLQKEVETCQQYKLQLEALQKAKEETFLLHQTQQKRLESELEQRKQFLQVEVQKQQRLQQELSSWKTRCSDLEKQAERHQVRCSDLEKQTKLFQQEQRNQQQLCQSLSSHKQRLEEEVLQLRKLQQQQDNEISRLTLLCTENEEKYNEMKVENKKCLNKLKKKENQLTKLKQQHQKEKEDVKLLQQQQQQYEKQRQHQQQQEQKTQPRKVNKKLQDKQDQVFYLLGATNLVDKHKSAVAKLQETLDQERDEYQQEAFTLKSRVASLELQVRELKQKNFQLEQRSSIQQMAQTIGTQIIFAATAAASSSSSSSSNSTSLSFPNPSSSCACSSSSGECSSSSCNCSSLWSSLGRTNQDLPF
jgi:chromosome segregation ATPase